MYDLLNIFACIGCSTVAGCDALANKFESDMNAMGVTLTTSTEVLK